MIETRTLAKATHCGRCGAIGGESIFCTSCGLLLYDETGTVERATFTRRFFGSSLLEGVLVLLTLIIGWFIWLIFSSKNGQSPAKSLTSLYVINLQTGRGIGRGETWIREVIVKILALGLINAFTGVAGLIDSIWVFFDKDRQALHDKVLKQVVVYAPNGLPSALANVPGPYLPPGSPFGNGGGVTGTTRVQDAAEQLRELARLRDEGTITAEEYETKRKAIADRI